MGYYNELSLEPTGLTSDECAYLSPARYFTKCPWCQDTIRRGDIIAYDKILQEPAVHESCYEDRLEFNRLMDKD